MFHSNRTARTLRARVGTLLCAALLTTRVMATPVLQTIAVTPSANSISVGQKQTFAATGTFSNGSRHALGPAISNIAPGRQSTCALVTRGGVECWGELGNGSTGNPLIPRFIKGISTATAVSIEDTSPWSPWAGGHGCALLARGVVKCWGMNTSGQLGNGTKNSSATPVLVRGIGSATAVAAGGAWEGAYTCALLASGTVKCWGANGSGQLGDGSKKDSTFPVTVAGISTAAALAVAGNSFTEGHSCAVLASGAVQCWGANDSGQLGNGTNILESLTPVTVIGIDNATAVAAGANSTCALLASGAVKCWGSNWYGQLGDGTGGPDGSNRSGSSTPVFVTGISTATAITVGENHACALLSSGSAQCWGYNYNGQLGNGTVWTSNIPVDVSGLNGATRLAAGEEHTCALLSDGAMRCWGEGGDGQLGNRRTTNANVPVNVVGTPGVVWESSNPTTATIGARGLATGHAVGNTTISATTAGFINDNAVLTVHQ